MFVSLPGGVDNLLHSSTFWLRKHHKTLNMNISVEVNSQDTGTSWLKGGNHSHIRYDVSMCSGSWES